MAGTNDKRQLKCSTFCVTFRVLCRQCPLSFPERISALFDFVDVFECSCVSPASYLTRGSMNAPSAPEWQSGHEGRLDP